MLDTTADAESSYVAVVHLDSPHIFLHHTIERVPDAVARVEYWTEADADCSFVFLTVRSDDAEEFESALDGDRTVATFSTLADFDGHRLYRIRTTPNLQAVTPAATDLGLMILDMTSEKRGWQLRLHVPSRDALVEYREYCTDTGISFTLEYLRTEKQGNLDQQPAVSRSQREALQVAYDRGYFSVPRETTLEELGEELDVSSTAVGRRLRRGLQTVLGDVLSSDTTITRGDG